MIQTQLVSNSENIEEIRQRDAVKLREVLELIINRLVETPN